MTQVKYLRENEFRHLDKAFRNPFAKCSPPTHPLKSKTEIELQGNWKAGTRVGEGV